MKSRREMILRHVNTHTPVSILHISISKNFIKKPSLLQLCLKRFSVNRGFERKSALVTEVPTGSPSLTKKLESLRRSTTSDWENDLNFTISQFSELPNLDFGINQDILINDELKEKLRQILWQFKAPIRYAFVYGSGVFPQSDQTTNSSGNVPIHPPASSALIRKPLGVPKMIDFIFGISYTQHWHSLNLAQNRDHYSLLGSLGSRAVSVVQDKWGAGVYFNPYVCINGIIIKYGVVNLDTLCTDLSEWKTLYLAGRLQKPVKILRDNPRIRIANQINLISALRTALLLLPSEFTEHELYTTISSISYMGDPRMTFPTENPKKVANIVGYNLPNFRRLYSSLIKNLPNICFNDFKYTGTDWISDPLTNLRLAQDMDPVKRGNIVRRLPSAFRSKLYHQYKKKFQIPEFEFDKVLKAINNEDVTEIKKREGGDFERRIANELPEDLCTEVRGVIKSTVRWPSTSQSLKGLITAGPVKTWKYLREKIAKSRQGK